MTEPTRAEIDQAKRQLLSGQRMRETARLVEAIFGSAEAQRIAREELAAEAATPVAPSEAPPAVPTSQALTDDYMALAEIEAERRALAAAGRPHGYDPLASAFGKGSRSTIQRRYKGLPPPGSPIPGVCDSAPPHAHHEG